MCCVPRLLILSLSYLIFRHFSKRPETYYKFYYTDTASGRRWNFINFCDYLLIQRRESERQKSLIVCKMSQISNLHLWIYTRVFILMLRAHLNILLSYQIAIDAIKFQHKFQNILLSIFFYKSVKSVELSWWVCHLPFEIFPHFCT